MHKSQATCDLMHKSPATCDFTQVIIRGVATAAAVLVRCCLMSTSSDQRAREEGPSVEDRATAHLTATNNNNGPLGLSLPPQQEEEEEAPPDQRELDLWLIESQVPRCTRDIAERAYAQGHGDVSRALPLARMATPNDFIESLRANGYFVLPMRDQSNPYPELRAVEVATYFQESSDPEFPELRDRLDVESDSDSDDEPMPLMLAPESSSSEDEAPIAGAHARLEPSISSRAQTLSIRRNVAKQNLRIIQEQLETEISNAKEGIVMTDGAYLIMMNALMAIWPFTKP